MIQEPLKRDRALVQFSKDHHMALLLVWKIREGLRLNVDTGRIKKYINFFFENFLAKHFKEEEELLLSELDVHDDLRLTAEHDHNELYQLNEQIRINPTSRDLREFATKLEQHIRFEERLLFVHLQKVLSRGKLNDIMEKMEAAYSDPIPDDWPDHFWKSRF